MIYPVQWYEGMLVSPHHFQTERQRMESILEYTLKLHPYPYGISHLLIDSILLNKGILRILEIDGMFEDGCSFSYRSEKHAFVDIQLNLKKSGTLAHKNKTMIYATITKRGALELASDYPRYIAMPEEEVEDLNQSGNAQNVAKLFPKITLYDEDNVPDYVLKIPILVIEKSHDGFERLAYTPPCFYLDTRGYLVKTAQSIAVQIRRRVSDLTLRYSAHGALSHIVQSLLVALCEIESYASSERIQPHVLYQIITRTLSYLLPLRMTPPPLLPRYNHDHIDHSIMPLFDVMSSLLAVLDRDCEYIPFDTKETGFEIFVKHEYMLRSHLYIGIQPRHAWSEDETKKWAEEATICSISKIDETRIRRVRGAKRRVLKASEMDSYHPFPKMLLIEIHDSDPFVMVNETLLVMHPTNKEHENPESLMIYRKL